MHDRTRLTVRIVSGEGRTVADRTNLGPVPYDVQTPVYEGPFDLLLHLILREEVDIHEVSLSTIVDGYLTELALMTQLDLEVATEFLLIAATLVELKSRRLLPGKADTDLDEEFALWEERDLLLARLLECKTFKDVSRVLAVFVDDADRVFGRSCGPDDRFAHVTPDPLEGMTVARLERAMLAAITPKKAPELSLWHVSPVRFTVAERVAQLTETLPGAGQTSFAILCAGMHERLEVIVTFLALLELFKQGAVEIAQFDRFGDITVHWSPETRVLAADVVDAYEG